MWADQRKKHYWNFVWCVCLLCSFNMHFAVSHKFQSQTHKLNTGTQFQVCCCFLLLANSVHVYLVWPHIDMCERTWLDPTNHRERTTCADTSILPIMQPDNYFECGRAPALSVVIGIPMFTQANLVVVKAAVLQWTFSLWRRRVQTPFSVLSLYMYKVSYWFCTIQGFPFFQEGKS